MYVEQFFISGLGCESYLIGCPATGVAAVIDPDRDVERYVTAAQNHSLKITHIIETHLHADHVSGNTELAARTGADIYLHEASAAEFAHRALVAAPEVGLLLPCNIVVAQTEAGVDVALVDPIGMLGFVNRPELEPIAAEARARLEHVAQALKE